MQEIETYKVYSIKLKGSYCLEGLGWDGRLNTNAVSTTWTDARKANTRREVEWSFENTKPSVSFDGNTLHDTQRMKVRSSLRQSQRAAHMTRLCELSSQGKVMEYVAADPASSDSFGQICRLEGDSNTECAKPTIAQWRKRKQPDQWRQKL
jgi:hypothetical protein